MTFAPLANGAMRRYITTMTNYVIADETELQPRDGTIKLHGPAGFAGMRKAGRLAAEILDALAPLAVPGASTAELDDVVREMTLAGGALPATLGYRGYTHSCCISINHVVCHGIPSDRILRDGDIVNIDVTPLLDGWHGDTSRMFLVGDVPLKARRLVEITYECLMIGIEAAQPGARMGDVGAAIQAHAERQRYGVVRDFCGHGGKAGVKILDDGWTAVTRDRSLSAQFEHSIGITEQGNEIFTQSPTGRNCPPYA